MRERRRSRALFVSLLVFALAGTGGTAHAQDTNVSSHDRARAQELFENALADIEAGRFAAACPKFAASHQADPKTSTLLNLGACYEKIGKTASAWGAFREAQGLARRIGRADMEATARSRAEALASTLVRLTIVVPPSSQVAGLSVSRDGAKLAAAEWGMGIPVDRGDHWISAEAPGRVAWKKRITVDDADRSIEVPILEAAPEEEGEFPNHGGEPHAVTETSWWTPARTTGVVLGSTGVAALATGFALAFIAKGNYDDARAGCSSTSNCPPDAVQTGNDARALATGGTVAIVAGSALAVTGLGLVVFSSSPSRDAAATRGPSARVGLLGPSAFGVSGRW